LSAQLQTSFIQNCRAVENDRQRFGCFALSRARGMGEKDLALQQLAIRAPTYAAAGIMSYGMLKLSPFWDPLRGDPCFEKIVASLAPKEAK
jgi:hypothetical protein